MPVAGVCCMHDNCQLIRYNLASLVWRNFNLDGLRVELIPAVGHCLVEHISLEVLNLKWNNRFQDEC